MKKILTAIIALLFLISIGSANAKDRWPNNVCVDYASDGLKWAKSYAKKYKTGGTIHRIGYPDRTYGKIMTPASKLGDIIVSDNIVGVVIFSHPEFDMLHGIWVKVKVMGCHPHIETYRLNHFYSLETHRFDLPK